MQLGGANRKLIVTGFVAVAAIATGTMLFAGPQSVTARYQGVARVPLPNFTRVELPGTPAQPASAPEAESVAADETMDAALALDTEAGETAARPAAGQTARLAPGNVIPVRFDIESPGMGDEVVGGDEIVVRKTVRIGNREVGSLPIHVDGRSRLLVRGADLRSVLESAGEGDRLAKSAASQDLRTFAELRKDGVDLRYDPASDSVVLTIG